jgi:trigger factor
LRPKIYFKMNISRTDLDALNATVTISIERKDFQEKVTSVLIDYRKKANIPGFRKGHVPMGMIKKQYEQAVTADEVNKILRDQLDGYLKEEKLNLLGNPLPKATQQALDWNAESMDFEFELGLAPTFDVKLDILKKVVRYEIEPDAKMLAEQLDYVRKQYGKLVSQKNPAKGYEITAQFRNEVAELDKMISFTLEDLKAKKTISELKEATTGTKLSLAVKGLFKDDDTAKRLLTIDNDKLAALNGEEITIEIKEINQRIPAELNQELFDKLYEPGTISNEKELKEKIKGGLQKQLEPQADQKLLNDITECLVEKTKFKLPSDFLKKWMQTLGKEPLSLEAAIEEFDKSEKGIRYQLIEGKIIEEHKLDITFEELKEFASSMVQNQMMQYGQQPDSEQIDGIVSNILKNQDETRRISEQLMSNKMLSFFKENAPLKLKKAGFDVFIKEAYGKT